MSTSLTDLSFVVMNLIGRNGAGPHDLVQMARRGQRLYWAGAESKIYAEPKRLEKLGYLAPRRCPARRVNGRTTSSPRRAFRPCRNG